jgi:hypothetical protein
VAGYGRVPDAQAAGLAASSTASPAGARVRHRYLLLLSWYNYVLTGVFMKMLIAGALTALTVTTAGAQGTKSANDVLSLCKLAPKAAALTDDVSVRDYAYCLGALDGLVMSGWRRLREPGYLSNPACFDVPEQAFLERETRRVVITYADRHPNELTQPFTQVAARALREAWPCKAVL